MKFECGRASRKVFSGRANYEQLINYPHDLKLVSSHYLSCTIYLVIVKTPLKVHCSLAAPVLSQYSKKFRAHHQFHLVMGNK